MEINSQRLNCTFHRTGFHAVLFKMEFKKKKGASPIKTKLKLDLAKLSRQLVNNLFLVNSTRLTVYVRWPVWRGKSHLLSKLSCAHTKPFFFN